MRFSETVAKHNLPHYRSLGDPFTWLAVPLLSAPLPLGPFRLPLLVAFEHEHAAQIGMLWHSSANRSAFMTMDGEQTVNVAVDGETATLAAATDSVARRAPFIVERIHDGGWTHSQGFTIASHWLEMAGREESIPVFEHQGQWYYACNNRLCHPVCGLDTVPATEEVRVFSEGADPRATHQQAPTATSEGTSYARENPAEMTGVQSRTDSVRNIARALRYRQISRARLSLDSYI